MISVSWQCCYLTRIDMFGNRFSKPSLMGTRYAIQSLSLGEIQEQKYYIYMHTLERETYLSDRYFSKNIIRLEQFVRSQHDKRQLRSDEPSRKFLAQPHWVIHYYPLCVSNTKWTDNWYSKNVPILIKILINLYFGTTYYY